MKKYTRLYTLKAYTIILDILTELSCCLYSPTAVKSITIEDDNEIAWEFFLAQNPDGPNEIDNQIQKFLEALKDKCDTERQIVALSMMNDFNALNQYDKSLRQQICGKPLTPFEILLKNECLARRRYSVKVRWVGALKFFDIMNVQKYADFCFNGCKKK